MWLLFNELLVVSQFVASKGGVFSFLCKVWSVGGSFKDSLQVQASECSLCTTAATWIGLDEQTAVFILIMALVTMLELQNTTRWRFAEQIHLQTVECSNTPCVSRQTGRYYSCLELNFLDIFQNSASLIFKLDGSHAELSTICTRNKHATLESL